jgi:hypothetical protein
LCSLINMPSLILCKTRYGARMSLLPAEIEIPSGMERPDSAAGVDRQATGVSYLYSTSFRQRRERVPLLAQASVGKDCSCVPRASAILRPFDHDARLPPAW